MAGLCRRFIIFNGLLRRVKKLASFEEPRRATYPADMLPAGLHWGSKGNAFAKNEAILCLKGKDDRPCIMRVVGRVSGAEFVDLKGVAKRRVVLNVVPWSQGTTGAVRELVAKVSEPPGGMFYVVLLNT